MSTQSLNPDTGKVTWDDGEAEASQSWLLPKGEKLDSSKPFNDGGLGARYRGTKADGIQIKIWNTNGGAYPDPNDGYVEVSVYQDIFAELRYRVTIKVYANVRGLFTAGNWMSCVADLFSV